MFSFRRLATSSRTAGTVPVGASGEIRAEVLRDDHKLSAVDWSSGSAYLHRRYKEEPMKTRIKKWGNSLALRIPRALASEARLEEGTPVDLALVGGKVVIRPALPEPPTLEELLKGVTNENLHGEWNTGPGVGREVG
jgi:antitoxin MazE